MTKKKNISISICLIILVITLSFVAGKGTEVASYGKEPVRILIDAGHGGQDPGKVIGNVKESDINLSIAKKMEKYLEGLGYEITMTRTDVSGLSKAGNTWNKDDDMQIRKDMITGAEYDIFISVHQNSYQDVSCKGGQVFYSDNNDENRILAETIQKKIIECAPFENHRVAMINNEYKLLKENKIPSIIVECGFMTNSMELELLMNEEYQAKLAEYIGEGIKE